MKPVLFHAAGLLAPSLFLASVVIAGARRPGYSHIADPVSLLGMAGAADGPLVAVAWAATGVLILSLGVGLWLDRQGPGRGTAVLIMLAGAASAAIAVGFPMDPPGEPASWRQRGHEALVAVAGIAFVLALLTAARSAAVPPWYRRMSWIALAAMIAGAAGAALSLAAGRPTIGLFERVTQGGYHVWLLITAALGLLRKPASALDQGGRGKKCSV